MTHVTLPLTVHIALVVLCCWQKCNTLLKFDWWASYQIHRIVGCACARNAFPTTDIKGNQWLVCVTHVPSCILVLGIPGACATRNFMYRERGPLMFFVRWFHCWLWLWAWVQPWAGPWGQWGLGPSASHAPARSARSHLCIWYKHVVLYTQCTILMWWFHLQSAIFVYGYTCVNINAWRWNFGFTRWLIFQKGTSWVSGMLDIELGIISLRIIGQTMFHDSLPAFLKASTHDHALCGKQARCLLCFVKHWLLKQAYRSSQSNVVNVKASGL